jgi:hypothetical protein
MSRPTSNTAIYSRPIFLFYFSRSSEFYTPSPPPPTLIWRVIIIYIKQFILAAWMYIFNRCFRPTLAILFFFFSKAPRTNLLLMSSTHLRCSVSWFGVLYNDGKWPPRCSAHDKWPFAVADKSFPPRPASLFLLYSIIDLFFYSLFLFSFFFFPFFFLHRAWTSIYFLRCGSSSILSWYAAMVKSYDLWCRPKILTRPNGIQKCCWARHCYFLLNQSYPLFSFRR